MAKRAFSVYHEHKIANTPGMQPMLQPMSFLTLANVMMLALIQTSQS